MPTATASAPPAVLLPHIVGADGRADGPHTSWEVMEEHTQAVRRLRRRAGEERAGQRRAAPCEHRVPGALRRMARGRLPLRQHQPDPRRPRHRRRDRMDPDPPEHRHRADARAGHVLLAEGLHDRGFLGRSLRGLRALPRLPDRRGRRPAQDAGLGGGDHRRARRAHHRAGARDGGERAPCSTSPGRCSARITASSRSGRCSRSPRCSARSACPAAASGLAMARPT